MSLAAQLFRKDALRIVANEYRSKHGSVEKESGSKHKASLWSGAIAIFILLTITAIRVQGDNLYAYPTNQELKELPSNATIICLAGGRGRIDTAFDLFSRAVGRELVIIGVGPKTSLYQLIQASSHPSAAKISAERLAKITLEKESRNTIENAYAVDRYLKTNPQVKEIVLITSSYHMRRSLYIFESLLGSSVRIIPYTPEKESIDPKGWWGSWIGIQVTVVEYAKYLFARFVIPKLGYF